MIKILPSIEPSGPSEVASFFKVAGARFNNTEKAELVASCPKGYSIIKLLDGGRCLLKKGFDKYLFYDLEKDQILTEIPSSELSHTVYYPDALYMVEMEESAEKTTVKHLVSDQLARFDGLLGYWKGELGNKVYLLEDGLLTCVDMEAKSIVWQVKQKGQMFLLNEATKLLFIDNYYSNKNTQIVWLDGLTGEKVKEKIIPYSASASKVSFDRIVMNAAVSAQERYILHYHVKDDRLEEIAVDSELPQGRILGDYFYQYLQEYDHPYTNGPSGESFIKRYDLYTGEPRGELRLPNVAFLRSPDYFKTPAGMGAVSHARVPWPEHHDQIILWDEDDFDNPDPEIYQEPLMGSAERVEEGDQAYYRVFVDVECESYFQLHRQLSVKLRQAGASKGYDYNNEEKPRDPEFNGKLICDVSNHKLNQRERLAVKHLCEHVEKILANDAFTSAYDPAKPIVIRPKFE